MTSDRLPSHGVGDSCHGGAAFQTVGLVAPWSHDASTREPGRRGQAQILERVVDGNYPPGTRLVELHLARDFRVSQGPGREAFRELAATSLHAQRVQRRVQRGRVGMQHGDGIAAGRLLRRLAHQVDLRQALLARGPHKGSTPRRGLQAADAGDVRALVKGSTAWHRAVVEAGNRPLMEMWDSLLVEVRTMATVVRGHVDLHAAAEKHMPLIEASERGETDERARLLADHQQEYLKLPQDDPAVTG